MVLRDRQTEGGALLSLPPGLKAGHGGLHNPALVKTEKRAFTKGRTCVQRQAAVGGTKAVIKSSVQSWRLVEEEA